METTTTESRADEGARMKRLQEHPFLGGLTHPQLALLEDCTVTLRFDPGEVIFHAGDPANRFYLLCEGRVALESMMEGHPMVLRTLQTGDTFGASPLKSNLIAPFTARAITPVLVTYFLGTLFRDYYGRDPQMAKVLESRLPG